MFGRRDSWFKYLFGFDEYGRNREALLRTRADFMYEEATGILKSKYQERSFIAGRFLNPSVAELRQFVARLCNEDKNRSVVESLKRPLLVAEVVEDVSKLHVNQDNLYATFQAASQFNCLEFVNENVLPEYGITGYANDRTQGPACAIACGPGTVVRNYFGIQGRDDRGYWVCDPQTSEKQVENLRDVEVALGNKEKEFFVVKGGYTLAGKNLELLVHQLGDQDGPVWRDLVEMLRVGVQEDTEVTSSCFGNEPFKGEPCQHLVTQVYASACSVAYTRASDEEWAPFACLVLEGAYKATMLAALINALRHGGKHGSRRVYLTMLGGGVFGNRPEWIVGAMRKAFEEFKGVGLEVFIVSYGRSSPELHGPEGVVRAYEGDGMPLHSRTGLRDVASSCC